MLNDAHAELSKTRELCGVTCDDNINLKSVYCNGEIRECDGGVFKGNDGIGFCKYSDPLTRTSGGNNVAFRDENGFAVYGGDRQLKNGDVIDPENYCEGCPDWGYFYGLSCEYLLDEAWCDWRKYHDKKNTEWNYENYTCKCLDDGQQWDENKHDCVKAENGEKTETVQIAGDLGEQYKSDIQELTGAFQGVVKVFVDDCQKSKGTIVNGQCQGGAK